jgi:hypothetical protein
VDGNTYPRLSRCLVGARINVKIIGDVNRFARLIAQGELIQPHVAGAAQRGMQAHEIAFRKTIAEVALARKLRRIVIKELIKLKGQSTSHDSNGRNCFSERCRDR